MTKSNLTKECPFCAEEIKQEAIFCKHCKSSLNEEETIEEEFSYSDFDGKKPPKKSKGNKLGGFIVLAVIITISIVIGLILLLIWVLSRKLTFVVNTISNDKLEIELKTTNTDDVEKFIKFLNKSITEY